MRLAGKPALRQGRGRGDAQLIDRLTIDSINCRAPDRGRSDACPYRSTPQVIGIGADRHGDPRAIGGRDGGSVARLSRRLRLVRPGLVGHGRRPGPRRINPAYCAFRAVYLPEGKHTVVFEYSPAGFKLGLCDQRLRHPGGSCALVLTAAIDALLQASIACSTGRDSEHGTR